MPPVIGLIIGIGIAATGTAAAATLAAGTIFGITSALTAISLIAMGASMIIGGVQGMLQRTPSKSSLALDKSSNSIVVRQAAGPRQIVIGDIVVGATLTYIAAIAGTPVKLHLVVTAAGHEVAGIDGVIFDNYELSLDSGGNEIGQYAGFCYVEFKTGYPGEPAFPRAITDTASLGAGAWTAAHRQDGCASVHLALTMDTTKFPNGVPNIRIRLRGKLLYDPRTGSTAYSSNLALAIRWYLTDTKYGLRSRASEINDTVLSAAANLADESVTLLDGDSTARYPCNGVFDTSKTWGDILQGLLSGGGGMISWISGQWCVFLGAWRPPSLLGPNNAPLGLTDDDLRGPLQLTTRIGRANLYSGVKGLFVSPTNNWQATDFPPMVRASYVCDDSGILGTTDQGYWADSTSYAVNDAVMSVGYAYACILAHSSLDITQPGVGADWPTYWQYAGEINWKDVEYPFTTDPEVAQRLAKLDLETGRRPIQLTLAAKLQGYRWQPPDIIPFTHTPFGWNAKTFMLQQAQLAVNPGSGSGDGPTLGADMILQEMDADAYAWSASDALLMASSGIPSLPDDSGDAGPVGYFQVQTGPYWASGSQARAHLFWDASTDPNVNAIWIQYKLHSSGTWTSLASLGIGTTDTYINLTDGSAYDFRIRTENIASVYGAWQEIDNLTVSLTVVGGATSCSYQLRQRL